jgi:hypothetical protein
VFWSYQEILPCISEIVHDQIFPGNYLKTIWTVPIVHLLTYSMTLIKIMYSTVFIVQ